MPGGILKRSDAPKKMRAQSVEILAHQPASAQTKQTRCIVRQYALEIPIGRSANLFFVTCSGVTTCGFEMRYFPDGFEPHVARGIVGDS